MFLRQVQPRIVRIRTHFDCYISDDSARPIDSGRELGRAPVRLGCVEEFWSGSRGRLCIIVRLFYIVRPYYDTPHGALSQAASLEDAHLRPFWIEGTVTVGYGRSCQASLLGAGGAACTSAPKGYTALTCNAGELDWIR